MKKILLLTLFMFVPFVSAKEIDFKDLFSMNKYGDTVPYNDIVLETGDKIININEDGYGFGNSGNSFCVNTPQSGGGKCFDVKNGISKIYGDYYETPPPAPTDWYEPFRFVGDNDYEITMDENDWFFKIVYYSSTGDLYKTDLYYFGYVRANNNYGRRLKSRELTYWERENDPYVADVNEIILPDLNGESVKWTLRFVQTKGGSGTDAAIRFSFVAEEDFKSYYDLSCDCKDKDATIKKCELKYNSKSDAFNSNVNILKSSLKINASNSKITNIKDSNGNIISNTNIIDLEREYKNNSILDILTFEIESNDVDNDTLSLTVLKTKEGYKDSNNNYLFLEREYKDMTLDIDYTKCINTSVLGEEVKPPNPKTGVRSILLYIIPLMAILVITLLESKKKNLFRKY